MAIQDIGKMLMGLSSGMQGRGNEFVESQQKQQLIDNEQQRLAQEKMRANEMERMKTVFSDSKGALKLGSQGRFDLIGQMGRERINILGKMGVDSSDTQKLTLLADAAAAGDMQARQQLMSTLSNNVEIGKGLGILKGSEPSFLKGTHISDEGQVVELVDGKLVSRDIPNFKIDRSGQRAQANTAYNQGVSNSLRARELALKESEADRRASKLSAGLEGALLKAQDETLIAQRNANEYNMLANDYERLNIEGGLASTVSESFKAILGSQDDISEFKRKFNQIRISEGLKNLPPGAASDPDIKMAFKGLPPENASPNQVASFLRGSSKMSRIEAGYNQFKSDFISSNSTAKGLNKEWRRSFNSAALGRKVSNVEVYQAAQDMGITPEQVRSDMGIK